MAPTTTALPVPNGTRPTPRSVRSITPPSVPEGLRTGRWPVPKLRPIPVWAQRVRSRSEELRARTEVLVRAGHLTDPDVVARVDELLDSATERAEHDWGLRAWTGFKDWWLGSSAETAWYQLHLAERLMLAGVEDETQLVALGGAAHRAAPERGPGGRRVPAALRAPATRGPTRRTGAQGGSAPDLGCGPSRGRRAGRPLDDRGVSLQPAGPGLPQPAVPALHVRPDRHGARHPRAVLGAGGHDHAATRPRPG